MSAARTIAPSGTLTQTITIGNESQSSSNQPQPETLVLRLRRKKKKVSWKEGTVDNEFLGKKSSKKCCIFHKDKPFDEDLSDDETDRKNDESHGHHHHGEEEFMSKGNLYDDIHKKKGVLKLSSLLKTAIDVSKGMEYLHSNGIIQRDLKTANLLMDDHGAGSEIHVAEYEVLRNFGFIHVATSFQ